MQGFIQPVLMSGRRLKKLDLLIEFSNPIFIKFYFKAERRWTCIQNDIASKLFSVLSYLFALQMWKDQNFSGLLPHKPSPGLLHEPVVELTATQDPHLHFATFENLIFAEKQTLVKLLGWHDMTCLLWHIGATVLKYSFKEERKKFSKTEIG